MKPEELWDALEQQKATNALYQQLLAMVKHQEPEYLAALAMLPPEQRQQVEDYVGACEALDDPLVYMAYCSGREGSPQGPWPLQCATENPGLFVRGF